ncbi:MAG: hypothetical protein DI606_18895 [Sphingobium sp.]|uniref:hypothetical protein n=1 Tax=Sphingobium sp. TaxID=1912891 RepID=UPI000DB8CBA3|nr:hypothetical protein [Sphingobium sp.]PZU05853.1 MAG: hypothetical protein DI606_18895 [Sphingobium sp.]
MHPADTLLLAYAHAQGTLERLDDRMRTSPVRHPWSRRVAMIERRALAWVDDFDLPEDAVMLDGRGRVRTSDYDLTHWKAAIGTPVSLKTILDDADALLDWFGYREGTLMPNDCDRRDMIARIERWALACRNLLPSPPLMAAAQIAAVWRRHAPLGRGDIVASLLIGDRWSAGRFNGSHGGLVALGLKQSGGPWKTASGPSLDYLWLQAIASGARAHLDLESRLRLFADRAREALGRRRRIGRLKDVLLLAMEQPAITSSMVARRFDLTSAGAIKLLSIAQDEGLLLERTGQASYRSYVIPIANLPLYPDAPSEGSSDIFRPLFWTDGFEGDPSKTRFDE